MQTAVPGGVQAAGVAGGGRLRRENDRLRGKLRQAELIIEIPQKASEILGIPLRSLDGEGSVS